MKIRSRGAVLLLPILSLFLLATRSSAQTGPDILIKPWETGQAFDISTEAVLEAANPTQENHADNVQLSVYDAMGRYRIIPSQKAAPTFGYDVMYVDVDTHDPALPRHLWNASVGFAQPLAEINKWFVVVTGAVGYAGDSPFADPHAVYYTGNLVVGRKFTDDKVLVFALNYDGNRTFVPDIPILAVQYADRFSPNLTYVIGFPNNVITYEPISGLQVVAGWETLSTFSGRVGWEFKKHYELYGSYTDRLTGFHLETLPPDRRLFLQEHRAEAGFRFNITKVFRISLGGGWAFGQEFSTGFDSRGTTPLRHLRDGPFGRALVEIAF
jgi:hypothetical protein